MATSGPECGKAYNYTHWLVKRFNRLLTSYKKVRIGLRRSPKGKISPKPLERVRQFIFYRKKEMCFFGLALVCNGLYASI